MRVICINDSNKPKQVPENKWIKNGDAYTVIAVVKLNLQLGKIGFKLKEIELDHSCFPYEYFDSERFSMQVSDSETVQQVEELLMDI
jgi:hypothetical protein